MTKTPITVARGDGIGPEIMDATLKILDAAGAQLDIEEIEIGEAVYKSGIANGIAESAWDSLQRTKIFLKAPITTPQGGGFKSLNVTIRKSMGLFANVRPCVAYAPYVETHHPKMDLVIVRYAFEYARANGRKKVTCMSKDNIMKISDGLFHKVFDEIATEYPDIENDHMIIDIGTAKVAANPEMFDVIVTLNLYGDIISDVAAEVTGSVGLGGSANIGADFAMFEAVHGSAPDIAGQGIGNPSGLLLGAIQMLVHIGQGDVAAKIHNAWLKTIEDGIHTGEIYREGLSKQRAGTAEFSAAVIERLGQTPSTLPVKDYSGVPAGGMKLPPLKPRVEVKKKRVGVDIGLNFDGKPDELAEIVQRCINDNLILQMISNRGTKVWPNGRPETFCADNWRLRFMARDEREIHTSQVIALMERMNTAGLNFTKSVMLHNFDGEPGFTVAQGE
jgi:isocitrate dehydrogenase